MSSISAIILTKNEEKRLPDCLQSLSFCEEIIVVDSGSTDGTVALAQKHKAAVYQDLSADFAAKRNLGLQKATKEWVLYVDADERISDTLKENILFHLSPKEHLLADAKPVVAYAVQRKNFYLGNHAWPQIERMERLFEKKALKGWKGSLHESPEVEGEIGELEGYLIHYSHQDLTDMVNKTNLWSNTEAALRMQAKHPPMAWWRFPRVMLGAFFNSYIKQRGFMAGTAGLVESMYQAYSMFITYAKLWELQQAGMNAPTSPQTKAS